MERAGPDELAFCTSTRYLDQLKRTAAGAVILKEDYAEHCPVPALVVANPYHAYARIASHMYPRRRAPAGIHPTAVVAGDAVIEPGAAVGPHVVIGAGARIGAGSEIGAGSFIGADVTIGADCWLAAGVYVGDRCRIGDRVLLHAGVVIGADGFGFAPGEEGWQKVPQLGIVEIGDDVEVGANSTIDRGALDDTVIGEGVKIDNLVHVAHNVRIGAHTVIAGCTVIAGSVTIGSRCVIGGASAITGHIEIVDGVTVMGMTGVAGHIREPGVYASPLPAQPVKEWRRNAVRFTQLDELAQRLKRVERELDARSAT